MYVGYLGPSGSFTHNAALKAFPEAELVSSRYHYRGYQVL